MSAKPSIHSPFEGQAPYIGRNSTPGKHSTIYLSSETSQAAVDVPLDNQSYPNMNNGLKAFNALVKKRFDANPDDPLVLAEKDFIAHFPEFTYSIREKSAPGSANVSITPNGIVFSRDFLLGKQGTSATIAREIMSAFQKAYKLSS